LQLTVVTGPNSVALRHTHHTHTSHTSQNRRPHPSPMFDVLTFFFLVCSSCVVFKHNTKIHLTGAVAVEQSPLLVPSAPLFSLFVVNCSMDEVGIHTPHTNKQKKRSTKKRIHTAGFLTREKRKKKTTNKQTNRCKAYERVCVRDTP
jgi:hypothetical protein